MLASPGDSMQTVYDEKANKSVEQSSSTGLSIDESLLPQHPSPADSHSDTRAAVAAVGLSGTNTGELSSLISTSPCYPADFNKSPEPLPSITPQQLRTSSVTDAFSPHQYHLLNQIQEDQVSGTEKEVNVSTDPNLTIESFSSDSFQPQYAVSKLAYKISMHLFHPEEYAAATWIGFWGLLSVTCANYVLTPMRDAVALQLGVQHMPKLTLASSVLAFLSSVPIGWLFEAPDPKRRKLWKAMGLTRGETQGTSLALFYRCFALSVLSYALGFKVVDWIHRNPSSWVKKLFVPFENWENHSWFSVDVVSSMVKWMHNFLGQLGHAMYIAFFLVVHLMKLHSLSLVWGVTAEAMEYEDVARQKGKDNKNIDPSQLKQKGSQSLLDKSKSRLQRLAMVGFGGTLGGILGSILASSLARFLNISGLLVLAAFLLEISAELSIELGRIMQKHWEEQQLFMNRSSCQDLASLDTSMKRSASLGSMKRVASGNTLQTSYPQQLSTALPKVGSGSPAALTSSCSQKSLNEIDTTNQTVKSGSTVPGPASSDVDENTFTQRLLRGVTTILTSRLLMGIFTYNALHASTSVLLSFQRAELVASRSTSTTVSADTAFLANINMASSVAVFAMQASGVGALIAHRCGSRGSLVLMPSIRLLAALSLAWWHKVSGGQPPNLILFLVLDECTRVVNLAVAKPVRESLWRGLSNEARYEAKPIVDTLANRWGGGSAAFCVSVINKALLWAGATAASSQQPTIFGFPPVLFLCVIAAAWWAMVSADLGQIRSHIDQELKKHQ